ncbi:camphor resistance protein CrcB [Peptostreptococcus anaerobius]|jgi:CrcB protein|uniref:Fluoride-specific ion channel FluC n=1 Tax=Peptostreptococcus anaerobius TaxID=1261 RepID=A0A135YXC3_9FIRM|nr:MULTISPECIES: CrcB family protein [Peptostreptococcus]EKX93438.1 putative protein CrcB [Peptostreptococcus anaerobius VPI 4330 = DSM 2949]KXI14058.1 putative protein CrcB [Peptostreptococcus anaerobius]MBS5595499.1 CrcB family protein [Peptostreptococcus sp.]MDB8820836.1 CrcB family protein [Peptostreptococcus anaerobius]MDB8825743.1 CrcB family protein [Peptostreptococcus anaerobius]
MLLKIFLICLGAGVGALARYKLGECIKNKNKKKWKTKFSLHTFIINAVGAFLLALSYYYMKNDKLVDLVQLGFCGGFTTYSTMFYEALDISNNGSKLWSIIYVLSSIFLGALLFLIVATVADL